MSKDDDWFRLDPTEWTDTSTSMLKTWPTATSTAIAGWTHMGTTGVAHGTGFYLPPEPDDIEISADDWKIIDDFIIDSVVRGHARRM